MEKLMHDLYNGCYDPHGRMHVTKSAYERMFSKWSEQADRIELDASDEQKERVREFVSLTSQLLAKRSEDDFIAGFQLGARLMIVALAEDGTLPM